MLSNLIDEVRNVSEAGQCQTECGNVADCNYFTWIE
jgi:hypothetical protein